MRTWRCPGHRTDGSRPWLQRRPSLTGSHEDGTAEPAMSDPDQPRRRSAGVARSPPAAGLPCGKTPRGPTTVARGRCHRRRSRSRTGGPATRQRRLAHCGCRMRDLRLRGHWIRQTHLKPAAITGHSRDLPDPREPCPYARKGLCHRRPRRDADFRTPAQAAARCGRGWGGAAAVLAWGAARVASRRRATQGPDGIFHINISLRMNRKVVLTFDRISCMRLHSCKYAIGRTFLMALLLTFSGRENKIKI